MVNCSSYAQLLRRKQMGKQKKTLLLLTCDRARWKWFFLSTAFGHISCRREPHTLFTFSGYIMCIMHRLALFLLFFRASSRLSLWQAEQFACLSDSTHIHHANRGGNLKHAKQNSSKTLLSTAFNAKKKAPNVWRANFPSKLREGESKKGGSLWLCLETMPMDYACKTSWVNNWRYYMVSKGLQYTCTPSKLQIDQQQQQQPHKLRSTVFLSRFVALNEKNEQKSVYNSVVHQPP